MTKVVVLRDLGQSLKSKGFIYLTGFLQPARQPLVYSSQLLAVESLIQFENPFSFSQRLKHPGFKTHLQNTNAFMSH